MSDLQFHQGTFAVSQLRLFSPVPVEASSIMTHPIFDSPGSEARIASNGLEHLGVTSSLSHIKKQFHFHLSIKPTLQIHVNKHQGLANPDLAVSFLLVSSTCSPGCRY
ncbi:hypothetical protein DV515_00000031 [Chloebia gouldiae]|uniref:Uncharacterized protein n=1 Tax=Chloebia gouldiae TaxID=44316 RepID=A0A3L8T2H2_CHLGU|nr:hypothetical protein DV515_00000031 [Chloebia gouldiae]